MKAPWISPALGLVGALLATVWADGSSAAAGEVQPRYRVTAVLPPEGIRESVAYGIDGQGRIFANQYLGASNRTQGYFGGKDIPSEYLGDLGGLSAGVEAVNSQGQAVGWSRLSNSSVVHGVIYTPSGAVDIGTLGGATSQAVGINDSGLVVGNAQDANGWSRPYSYQDGVMTDLSGVLTANARPAAVNNAGHIAGSIEAGPGLRGFYYGENGLEILGLMHEDDAYSEALDVNNLGWVVGISENFDTGITGFLYVDGQMTSLGDLGVLATVPYAINDSGWIVGSSVNDASQQRGFLYKDGQIMDLNDLVDTSEWTILLARDINANGWIAATGVNAAGEAHALLLELIPVPEPGSLALLAAGCGVIVVAARRKSPSRA